MQNLNLYQIEKPRRGGPQQKQMLALLVALLLLCLAHAGWQGWQLRQGAAQLRQADFAGGLAALNSFLKRYPATGYKESALYWLGNAYYGQRDYKQSITVFRSLLSSAPQHMRAPEAMLSIANCHTELKETKAARKALDDLIKGYPDSEAALVARERLASASSKPKG